MSCLHDRTSLQIFSHGLSLLHDPNWAGQDFYYLLKDHLKGRREPTGLLLKPLAEGLPLVLGRWFYEDYFRPDRIKETGDEYRAWHLQDVCDFLLFHSDLSEDRRIQSTLQELLSIDEMYDSDEDAYFRYLSSDRGRTRLHRLCQVIRGRHSDVFDTHRDTYAADFADRLFHDRQLCAFVAETVRAIGFPGRDEHGVFRQWVERERWPQRVKDILTARDRGKCAKCHADISMELEAECHIDHIVPISVGGCNDVVNLQMLCSSCNLKKSNNQESALSSVPPYIRLRLRSARDRA